MCGHCTEGDRREATYLESQAHQVGSPETGPPGSFLPEPGPPGSFSREHMKLLVDSVEYSARNTRHVIDAAWMEHSGTSGHRRQSLDQTLPCAVCITLAGADQQNNGLIVQLMKLNRDMFRLGTEIEGNETLVSSAEVRHERLTEGLPAEG